MTYTLGMLIILSLYCLYTNRINKYSWCFFAVLFSLIVSIYTTFLLLSTSGYYVSLGGIFNDLDRTVYLLVTQKKPNLFRIIRIFNFSVSLYFFALFCLINLYFKFDFFNFTTKEKVNRLLNYGVVAIFSVGYYVFYDPIISTNIFFATYNSNTMLYFYAACFMDAVFHIASYLLVLSPLFLLFKFRMRIKTYYKSRQIIGVILFILLTDIIFFLVLKISSMRGLYWGNTPDILIKTKVYGNVQKVFFFILPVATFFAIVCIMTSMKKFYLVNKEGFITRTINRFLSRYGNKNIMTILHSVKNEIFAYKVVIDDLLNEPNEKQVQIIHDLSEKMDAYINDLTALRDTENKFLDFMPEQMYVSDILDECIEEFPVLESIKIVKNYKPNIEMIHADAFYLKDAFTNILQNASDAILAAKQRGTIRVSIVREFDLVAISFEDDGIGIKRKNLHKVFKAFYTTNNSNNNWGLGLLSVFKIVKEHKGNISLQSKHLKGTTITIILPRIQAQKNTIS